MAASVDDILKSVVGRRSEIEQTLAALSAKRHLLLEGPPGTGKSTLLRAVAQQMGGGFHFVEGNAELTPARLVGTFDPAAVLDAGYSPDVFLDGPLCAALRDGSMLYIEEINRIPEETLNVIISVMSEGAIEVPRLGTVAANDGFRIVAAMNPFDAVGTARISAAVYDRMCRIEMGYQSASEELGIVSSEVADAAAVVGDEFVARATELVRLTRSHGDVRSGSSVRGAIDIVAVGAELAKIRSLEANDPLVTKDACQVALSGRIRVREGSQRSASEIIEELWSKVFAPRAEESGEDSSSPEDGSGKA